MSIMIAVILTPLAFFLISRYLLLRLIMHMDYPDLCTTITDYWSDKCAGREMYVGTVDGRVLAMVGLARVSEDTVEVQCVVTEQGYTGQGLARHMMSVAVARSQQLDYKYMVLETSEVQLEAQHLYRSMGFKVQRVYTKLLFTMQRFVLSLS